MSVARPGFGERFAQVEAALGPEEEEALDLRLNLQGIGPGGRRARLGRYLGYRDQSRLSKLLSGVLRLPDARRRIAELYDVPLEWLEGADEPMPLFLQPLRQAYQEWLVGIRRQWAEEQRRSFSSVARDASEALLMGIRNGALDTASCPQHETAWLAQAVGLPKGHPLVADLIDGRWRQLDFSLLLVFARSIQAPVPLWTSYLRRAHQLESEAASWRRQIRSDLERRLAAAVLGPEVIQLFERLLVDARQRGMVADDLAATARDMLACHRRLSGGENQ